MQSFGGANDFLEHRRAFDFFAQHEIFILRPFLAPFAVVNIRSRCIPANEASLFVAEWAVSDDEPTIPPILSARSRFDFKRLATLQARLPFISQPFQVVRMYLFSVKAVRIDVFRLNAGVFVKRPIRVKTGSIGFHHDDVVRYGIGYLSKLDLVSPELLFRLLSVLDIGVAAKPLDDIPLLIE